MARDELTTLVRELGEDAPACHGSLIGIHVVDEDEVWILDLGLARDEIADHSDRPRAKEFERQHLFTQMRALCERRLAHQGSSLFGAGKRLADCRGAAFAVGDDIDLHSGFRPANPSSRPCQ